MTVLSVEGQKYYSADVVIEKRGDLFEDGKPRSIFLNKKVEINKANENDCRFFYLKENEWTITTRKYCKATVFFSEEWLKKMKIKVAEDIKVEGIKPVMERTGVTAGAKVEENIEIVFEKLKRECKDTITDSDKGLFKAYKLGDSHYITDYFDFKNVIVDKNGYVNATKLCWKGGREYYNWIKTVQAKDMIKNMDKLLGTNALPYVCKGANKSSYVELSTKFNTVIKGTYLHPDLVVHLASWISFEFANKVSQIVKRFVTIEIEAKIKQMKLDNMNIKEELSKSEIERQKAEEERQKAEEERQKAEEERQKAEAARQEEKLARQRAEQEYAKAEAARQEEKLARQRAEEEYAKAEIERQKAEEARIFAMEKLSKIGKTLNKQCKMTDKVLDVVEETASRFVPPTKNKGDTEYCVCFELIEGVKYSINRIQERAILKTEKALREQYPNAKMFYKMETVNSVNVFSRLKDYFENVEEVDITYTKITVTDEYIGREDIVDALKNIHDKKYNACAKVRFIKRKTQKHSDYYNVD